jgi:PAS domain-containing protein
VTEAGVKAIRLAEAETPARGREDLPSWQPWRSHGLALLAVSLTLLLIGIVSLSATSLSFLQADDPVLPATALYLLAGIGVLCLAVAQWRTLLQTNATARERAVEIERLERELAKHQHSDEMWPHGEERYRTPLDQIRDYTIFLLAPDGKPTSWNPGVQRVLGYDKAEFLETSAADLYTVEDREVEAPARDLI